MKPLALLLVVQTSAVLFTKYYHNIWDIPSILTFETLFISAGYLIIHLVNYQR